MEAEVWTSTNEEVTMRRFIALVALAGVAGFSSAATVRDSTKIEYTPKLQFTLRIVKSPEIPPGYELQLEGLERITWINESTVPCSIVFYQDTARFSVSCDGMDPVQDDLRQMPPGKKYIYRIKME